MKRKEKMVGFILGIITGAAVMLSLGGLSYEKGCGGRFRQSEADGPTTNIYSGKIDFTPVYKLFAMHIEILAREAGYMIYRKNKKEGS